jgi:acetylornithine/N-succinyldiaminopimelate aminotransferase
MKKYLMDTLNTKSLTFVSGFGSKLIDSLGGEYIDFFTDVGTSSLGYGGSTAHQKAKEILSLNPFHAPNLYGWGLRSAVAKQICDATGMDRVFFCNSGTESVEAALKLMRKYQHDSGVKNGIGILGEKGGFHGRTYGSLAVGDGPSHHYKGFGPLPEGFAHFEFNTDEYKKFRKELVCGIMISPVFGNNDVRVPDDGWLKELRAYTSENNMLLAFDEVQSGSGRTGAMTYAQKIGVKPDIITLAKGIGMGMPVGVMLATEEVAKAFTPGSHFSTFGGNPASVAAVTAMLDWLSLPESFTQIIGKGEIIRGRLREAGAKGVRGAGMLNAFDIDTCGLEFASDCLEEKLLVGAFRPGPGPVKITPPLNIESDVLDEGLRSLCKIVSKHAKGM